MGSVYKLHTKLSDDKAFLIFLGNLYYLLDCSDQAFIDILSNIKSNVTVVHYTSQMGKQTIDSKAIGQKMSNFKHLGHAKLNELYQEFLFKNDINENMKVG